MVLKLLYSASDSVQVLRCFYVRRSIGSVEKSSGVRFYTATLAPDERLKSAGKGRVLPTGKGRVPPRTSCRPREQLGRRGVITCNVFLRASRGNSKHIISMLVLATYCVGPSRPLLSGHTPSVPLDPCSRDILYWSPSTRGKDKRIRVQGGTRGYIDYPPSLRAPSHSFPPIKSKIW